MFIKFDDHLFNTDFVSYIKKHDEKYEEYGSYEAYGILLFSSTVDDKYELFKTEKERDNRFEQLERLLGVYSPSENESIEMFSVKEMMDNHRNVVK